MLRRLTGAQRLSPRPILLSRVLLLPRAPVTTSAPAAALAGDRLVPLAPVTVDGRRFVPTEPREMEFVQYVYLASRAEAAGLNDTGWLVGLDAERAAIKLLTLTYDSGYTFELLAGVLVEEGKAFDETDAAANAALFTHAKGEAIPALTNTLLGTLVPFLPSASSSVPTSPSSSNAPETPTGTTTAGALAATAEVSTSANGPTPSASSPTATRGARTKSRGGPSGRASSP